MSRLLVQFGALTAMFLTVAAVERVPRLQYTPSRFRRPWFGTDVAWYLLAALTAGLATFLLRPILTRLATPGISAVTSSMPAWAALIVAVVIFDGVFFAIHVGLHRSELLWTVHKVHHSSRRLDFLATTRTHAFEQLVRNVPSQLVLFSLGFRPATIASSVLVLGGFGVLNHSNLRLPFGRLEWLLITPRLHRVHHVPATSGNNYATIFSVWDRAAGTLVRRDTPSDAVLGVPDEVQTFPQPFARAFREPLRQIHAERRERGPLGDTREAP
jgi:sterol desaturase/sphingolipid hydroxylase (fatty acid hydroxylase superfamily)